MAWYEGKKGGSGEVSPSFILENGGTSVTINDADIGDYYIIAYGYSSNVTVTGADIVYNETKGTGNAYVRTVVVRATSTTITVARGTSAGAIMATKLDLLNGIWGTEHIEACFMYGTNVYASGSKTSTDGTFYLATYAAQKITLLKDCWVTVGVYSGTSTTTLMTAGTELTSSQGTRTYILREA